MHITGHVQEDGRDRRSGADRGGARTAGHHEATLHAVEGDDLFVFLSGLQDRGDQGERGREGEEGWRRRVSDLVCVCGLKMKSLRRECVGKKKKWRERE